MKYLSLLIASTFMLCLQPFNHLKAQTFDWTAERFDLTVRLNDGTIKENYTVPAPRRQAGIWDGVSDLQPEDGWILLGNFFGTVNDPLNDDLEGIFQFAPYYILYNKFTGILRLFTIVPTTSDFTNGYITLKFDDSNSGLKANFLTYNQSAANALDKDVSSNGVETSIFAENFNGQQWVYADFPMAYDPDITTADYKNATLLFVFTGNTESTISLELNGKGLLSTNQSEVRDFLSGSPEGSFNFMSPSENVGQNSTINDFFGTVGGAFENGESFAGFVNNLADSTISDSLVLQHSFLGPIRNTLSTFADAVPLGNAALSAINFFVGGGFGSQPSFPTRFFTANKLQGGGDIITSVSPATVEIPIPGGSDSNNLPAGVIAPLNYNKPLGVFNLKETPVLEYKKFFQPIEAPHVPFPGDIVICDDCVDGQEFHSFRLKDTLDYVVNPNAGVSVESIKTSIVGAPFADDRFSLQVQRWLEDGMLAMASDEESNLNVESFYGNEMKFRNPYVPNSSSQYQVLNLPKEDNSGDPSEVFLKIQVQFKRNDDPNAELISAVYTYNADVEHMTDDGSPWTKPFPLVINENRVLSGDYLVTGDAVVKNNSTLEISSGSNIYIAPGKRLSIKDGSKLIASNVNFTNSQPGQQYERIQLGGTGSRLSYCTVSGGEFNVYVAGDDILIERGSISNGKYGIYASAADNLTIRGTTIENNSSHGVYSWSSEVNFDVHTLTTPNSTTETPTSITNNGGRGIYLNGYSRAYLYRTVVNNNSNQEIYLRYDSRLFAGDQYSTSTGKNFITDTGGYYIYSLARTSSGESFQSWRVPAENNFWGSSDAPSSNSFFGYIDYDNHLSENQAGPFIIFDEFGCSEDPCPIQNTTRQISTMGTVKGMNYSNEEENDSRKQRLIEIKEKLTKVRNEIRNNPLDLQNGRLLKEEGMLTDILANKNDKAIYKRRQNRWLNSYLKNYKQIQRNYGLNKLKNMREDLPKQVNNESKVVDRLTNMQHTGEAAILLKVEEAIYDNKFTKAQKLVTKYNPYVLNKDNQVALMVAKASILQSQKKYDEAYEQLERIEEVGPDNNMTKEYVIYDYKEQKNHLEELIELNNLTKSVSNNPNTFESNLNIPEEFTLSPAYPNPFNPSTQVPFALPEAAEVRVEVYSITGRLVAVLANTRFEAGRHTLAFNASGLASGVYLVRARLGEQVQTRKITLVK